MATEGGWKPQRSLDRESRHAKAAKISALIERRRPLHGARLLEIGTGAGIIASLLSDQVDPGGSVLSVDVDDLRTVTDGYEFRLVEGVELPSDDVAFDIVVSNHTIEHVGGPDAQLMHLREIARVLRSDGVCYLASPSRWALVEPHFKVPMLSWLPPSARTKALRFSRRGQVYDISPRTRPELLDLVQAAGLQADDVTVDALRVTAGVEKNRLASAANAAPESVLTLARGALPTMVMLLSHPRPGA
jgi:SAM-dependent methyltransferase